MHATVGAKAAPAVAEDLAPHPPVATADETKTAPIPEFADAARDVEPSVTPRRWAYSGILSLIARPATSTLTDTPHQEWLTHMASATKSALQQLQLQAKLLSSALTPNTALLRFAGTANLTIDQVLKKRSEPTRQRSG